jgi:asparagine synthase (glutamine-hydrolysing)
MRKMLEGKLPEYILSKPKKGFGPPASAWVGGVLREQFLSVLSPEKVHQQGIFQSGEIDRLLREHLARRTDHGRNLWAILSFQLWYDSFIEGKR